MGIDASVLNLMRHEHQVHGDFGDFVMLGRQEIHVPAHELEAALGTDPSGYGRYCEELVMDHFGAPAVSSIDNSDFEGATHVFDLGASGPELPGPFDTLLDAGTLEHVFHLPNALANVSALVRPGGRIMHVLPANNQCGHGFWQFSPELFFSLYSPGRGYADTEVYVVEVNRPARWWRVSPPTDGTRVTLSGFRPLYVMCRTTRTAEAVDHAGVQQSDYVHAWQVGRDHGATSGMRERLKKTPAGPPLLDALSAIRSVRSSIGSQVARWNPHLTPVAVSELLR